MDVVAVLVWSVNTPNIYKFTTMHLGIDQSYTSTGYCILDETGTFVNTFGTFKSTPTADTYDRSLQVADFITTLIMTHNITNMCIEGLAFGIRGDATRDLAGLLFVVITNIRSKCNHVRCIVVAPTSLKKFATGSGKADKAAMISAVPEMIQEKFKQSYKKTTGLGDVSDAYWLAQYSMSHK